MKLHLPKLLLTAVLAAVNTVGFQAHAEWAYRGDGYNAYYFYDKEADFTKDSEGRLNLAPDNTCTNAEELRICPESQNQVRTIYTVALSDSNKIFKVAQNPWANQSGNYYGA